jgi:hypothetical protein
MELKQEFLLTAQGDRVLHFLGLVVKRFDVGLYVKSRDTLASLASTRETHGR